MKKNIFGVLLLILSVGGGGTSSFANNLDSVSNNKEAKKTRTQYTPTKTQSKSYKGDGSKSVEFPKIPGNNNSFGRSIFGVDNRYVVSDTTQYPYRASVLIVSQFPNGQSMIGTGSMISKDTVLTAGHCIYMRQYGGWANSVIVYPGYNGNYAPFGSSKSIGLRSITGWTTNQSSAYDIGAIKLDKNIGNTVGYFGLTTRVTNPATISGYHFDKQDFKMRTQTGYLNSYNNNNIYYNMDTMGGSSGSGIYNLNYQIMGINAYENNYYNMGTRLNNTLMQKAISWTY